MSSAGDVVERFLRAADIEFARLGGDRWSAMLRGERKLTIPVQIAITRGTLVLESFFMRRPQENHDRFFEMLLRRNMRAYGVHFAVDPVGDVYLVTQRASVGLDDAELDRLLGALLVEADGLFDTAIRLGFASYLEADLRWRERAGIPPPAGT